MLLVVTGDFAGHRLDGYRFVAKACETHFSDRHKQWRSYIKRANHPPEILQDAHQTIAWEAKHFYIDIALAWVFVWNFINYSIRIWSLPCHAVTEGIALFKLLHIFLEGQQIEILVSCKATLNSEEN